MAEFAHIEALARSPGERHDGIVVARSGLRIAAAGGLAQATVSLHPGSARKRPATAFKRAVGDVLGTRLPSTPNSVAGSDPYALWLAPERWRLVGARKHNLLTALTAALAGVDAAVVAASVSDASDASLLLDIGGARGEEFLAMACSLDLQSSTMAAGYCARSLFAGQHALLYRHGGGFRVHLDATLGVFVCGWCRQAAALLDA